MKGQKIKVALNNLSRKLNTPTTYSSCAVVGVLATAVLAIVATRKHCQKANEEISQEEFLAKEPTTEERIESVKETLKIYAPTIIFAAATIFCIKKADKKWLVFNNLINASYLAARERAAHYRLLAPAAVAAELAQGFQNKPSAEEGIAWFCLKDFPIGFDGEYDEFGKPKFVFKDIWFQSTSEDVLDAMYHLNRNFTIRTTASTREFFAFLGILDMHPEIWGDALGWDGAMFWDDGLMPWIDFERWHYIEPSTQEVINMIAFTWDPWISPNGEPFAYGYGEGYGLPGTLEFSPGPHE